MLAGSSGIVKVGCCVYQEVFKKQLLLAGSSGIVKVGCCVYQEVFKKQLLIIKL